MADSTLQRTNMVESQIRPSDVTDRRILRAMQDVPREAFVPAALQSLAYMDDELPIGRMGGVATGGRPHRALLSPRTFAKLLQLAEIGASDRVLDVGAGRGYSSAVLAKLAGSVIALEVDPVLADEAGTVLAALNIPNAAVKVGPLAAGHPSLAPFDVIVIEGVVPDAPDALLQQLKDGGRLVAILSGDGIGRATVWRRIGQRFAQATAFETGGPGLPGFDRAAAFTF